MKEEKGTGKNESIDGADTPENPTAKIIPENHTERNLDHLQENSTRKAEHQIYKIASPKINLALSCGIGGAFMLVGALLLNAKEESWWLLIVIGALAIARGLQIFWKEHHRN